MEDKKTGETERIIVIGGSTGGFEAIKTIVKHLPSDFKVPICIVWHMSPGITGLLPFALNQVNSIPAEHARDNEVIDAGRIYVAPPDHHLLIEDRKLRITQGPKENRFRPAIDPLFRSAAYAYGNGVIGVILTGALDDGTAGLWRIKHNGGIAIVQDPADAEVSSMPQNAIREVKVDYCLPVAKMADLLVSLCAQSIHNKNGVMNDATTKIEIDIAAEKYTLKKGSLDIGEPSTFSCPECHGVLSRIKDGNISRFRCHTGHAFSADSLMASIGEKIEDSLYEAIRGMDESVALLNHLGDHFAEANQPKMAAQYFQKASEAEYRSQMIRKTALRRGQMAQNMSLPETNATAPEFG